MLFAQHIPEILDMRVPRVHESLTAIPSGKLKTFVRIAVAGNDMVAWLELLQYPPVEPGKQSEPERLRLKWA
jgi:hypothetical protein